MSENVFKLILNDWKRRRNAKHDGCKYDADYADLYLQEDYGGRLKRCIERMNLKPNENLLDIGCGNGMLARLAHDKVCRYLGYDISVDMIRQASKFPNVTYVGHIDLVLETGAYHAIALFDLVEHAAYSDMVALLRDLRKVCRRGTRLYIHTPNADYFMEKLKAWGILPQIAGHIAVRDARQLRVILESNGFSVKKIEYLSHYNPLLKWAHALSYLPFIGKYFKARLWIEAWA